MKRQWRGVSWCATPLQWWISLPRSPRRKLWILRWRAHNVFNSILKAQAAKCVVLTSSVVAVSDGSRERGHTFTEEDWHQELTLKDPYSMGKTMAEQLAWKMCEEQKAKGKWSFDLVSICPGLVIGEGLHKQHAFSVGLKLLTQVMDGAMPMAPDFYFSLVHVRDVALAHILGLEREDASGRYLVAKAGTHSVLDIAGVIKTVYPRSKLPTRTMPTFLLYAVALVNPMLSFDSVQRMAGTLCYFSNKKLTSQFGVALIPPEQAILDSAKFLIDQGTIPYPKSTLATTSSLPSMPKNKAVAA